MSWDKRRNRQCFVQFSATWAASRLFWPVWHGVGVWQMNLQSSGRAGSFHCWAKIRRILFPTPVSSAAPTAGDRRSRKCCPAGTARSTACSGELDRTTAADGAVSLKIELTPENLPIAYNDYLHTERQPIKAPLAANVGWMAVKPGQRYVYSVAMKAAEAGTPARLVVRQFHAAPVDKLVRLTTDWQRYRLEFTAAAEACYVLAGPDLRPSEDNPHPPERATVWLDAVQLSPGENPDDRSCRGSRSNWESSPTSRAMSLLGRNLSSSALTVASCGREGRTKSGNRIAADRFLRRGSVAR